MVMFVKWGIWLSDLFLFLSHIKIDHELGNF
jgi:hypothetical protein